MSSRRAGWESLFRPSRRVSRPETRRAILRFPLKSIPLYYLEPVWHNARQMAALHQRLRERENTGYHLPLAKEEFSMNLVLLGPPGSGKGTQAKRLHERLSLQHVASGDLFRENLNNETALGKRASEFMNRGELVPDELTIEMLRERLSRPDVESGVVLDGFPRTLPQAQALDLMLDSMGKTLDVVLLISVSDEEIVARLSGRLVCRKCQLPFHQTFNPFRSCPSHECNGEFLYQREDDRPETVRARLRTYHKQTAPLITLYEERGSLVTVNGVGSLDEVTQACLTALGPFLN